MWRFISNLMESGVEFHAVDFPQANRLTVHIVAASWSSIWACSHRSRFQLRRSSGHLVWNWSSVSFVKKNTARRNLT
jgi:hypothetical protein